MTSFRPVNDDQAVEVAIFQLMFDIPLGPDIFAAAHAGHAAWQDELPAIQLVDPHPVELPGFLALPPQTSGLSFAHLRPDGLPAWQLRFDQGSISVLCTRYIRWERAWKTARRYLGKALELVAGEGRGRKVTTAMLQFARRFETAESGYDLATLLNAGHHLPPAAFGLGPVWHNNMGWFDKVDALGDLLHNLNIASNRLPRPDAATLEDVITIGITHIQELRLLPGIGLADVPQLLHMLDRAMDVLHALNEALITDMIAPNMADRLGLAAIETPEPSRWPQGSRGGRLFE